MTFDKHVDGNSLKIIGAINISELVSFLQNRTNITKLSLLEVRDESLKGLAFRERFTSGCLKKGISVKGIKELAKLKNLTSLDLSGSGIGVDGAKELAKLKNLTSLNLSGDDVTDEGVKELAKLKNLTSLNLGRNYITDEGVKELAKLKNLTSLYLSSVNISVKGIKELAKLKNLTSLDLSGVGIGIGVGIIGTKELAKLKKLTSLCLNHNMICDEDVEALANGNLKNLTSLDLEYNYVGDKGAEALANGNLKNLTSLNLQHNSISDKGAKALANGNLKNLTSLDLRHNGIFNQGAKELAKLKNLTSLYLSHYSRRTLETQKALAEFGKKVILDRNTDYCHFVQDAWSKNSNASILDEDITKKLFFKLAAQGHEDWVVLLLNDLDKYPFLINSRDEEGHTLSHFFTHFPKMQEFLFERGLIPEEEPERDTELQNISRDRQSVHSSSVAKRTRFTVRRLVEFAEASKDELEQAATSYMENIPKLLKQYQNDSVRIKLLSLTENEKKSVMENTLPEGQVVPNDKEFIKTIIEEAKEALEKKYLRKGENDEYVEQISTAELQYDYMRDNAKVTIPKCISYVKLLIDKIFIPLEQRKELLVTLANQNLVLVREKLPKIILELENSTISQKQITDRAAFYQLLDNVDGSKIDKLFKEISDLSIEKIWKEQKEFILLKQIYIAATTYKNHNGEISSACTQGTWSQIINSVSEIDSELMDRYAQHLDKERKEGKGRDAITEENITPFVENLAEKLIQYVENNPELKDQLCFFKFFESSLITTLIYNFVFLFN